MDLVLISIYAISAVILLTMFIFDLKNQDRICVVDVLMAMVFILTPILNTTAILALVLDYLDIQWSEIFEKEIWRRK